MGGSWGRSREPVGFDASQAGDEGASSDRDVPGCGGWAREGALLVAEAGAQRDECAAPSGVADAECAGAGVSLRALRGVAFDFEVGGGVIDAFSWQEGGKWHHGPFSNGFIEPDGSHVEGEYQAYAKTKVLRERDKILYMVGGGMARRPPFGPDGAKAMGRKVPLRRDHEEVKVPVMAFFVARKFREHEVLRAALLGTGQELLVEGNSWHDNYWGDCRCDRCAGVKGRNVLGTILMAVRATLL